jgi:hypothetical protein
MESLPDLFEMLSVPAYNQCGRLTSGNTNYTLTFGTVAGQVKAASKKLCRFCLCTLYSPLFYLDTKAL